MADSNTARSKRWLEKQGWKCWSTEQIMRIPPRFPGDKPKVWKVDAFNFGDLICYKPVTLSAMEVLRRFVAAYDGERWPIENDIGLFEDARKAISENSGIMLVQSTTVANQAARVTKIQGIPEAEGWLRSGGRIQVHGWRQKGGKGGRWILTVQEIGLDGEFPGTLKSEEKSAVEAPLFEE